MLIPSLAFPAKVIICMIILHPVESKLRGSVCVSVFTGRERILLSIHRPVQQLSFFLLSLPVLYSDGDMLKMLNAHCFHGDNTFMLYFLELFPLAVKPGLVFCCIQLASHRQQRQSSTGQTKKKKSWIGHFTDENSVPLIPPRNLRICKCL